MAYRIPPAPVRVLEADAMRNGNDESVGSRPKNVSHTFLNLLAAQGDDEQAAFELAVQLSRAQQ